MAIGIDSYNVLAKAKTNHASIAPVIDRRMRSRLLRSAAKKPPRDFRMAIAVMAVLVASVMAVAAMSAFVGVTRNVCAYSPHQPIVIAGDAGFTIANGVTSGNGTASDPFMIFNWEIDTTTKYAAGIVITDTQAHFVIQSVWVHGTTDYDGIELFNVRNATIKDSRIDNNSAGLYMQDSFGVTLDNVTLINNPNYAVYSYSSNNFTIANSSLNLNGYGAYIDPAVNSVRFDNCSISWNDYGGLYFYSDATNVEIVDCEIDYNQYEQGIYVYGSVTNFAVRNSSVSYNEYDGIRLDDYCNGFELSNSTVVQNYGYGLYVYGGDGIWIADSTLSVNSDTGIEIGYRSSAGGCIVVRNEVSSNDYHGIVIDGQMGVYFAGNTVADNNNDGLDMRAVYGTIEDNLFDFNSDYGLFLQSSTSYVTVSKNTFIQNGAYVEFSYQTGNSFSDNTVNGRPLVYLYDVDDHVVADAGQVIAAYSDRLTVQDLNLSVASIGVELWDCDDGLFERLDCRGGMYGMLLFNYSDSNFISDCNLSGCYASGLHMNTGCSLNAVSGCDMNDTYQIGIYLYWGCNSNTFTGCYGVRSYSDGARIQYSNGNRLSGCTFGYNSFNGVYLIASDSTRVEDITSTNSMYGMTLSDSSASYLANNTVRDCSNSGIALGTDSNNNVVFQNLVRNCNWGVRIEGSAPIYTYGNQVRNNTIELNAGRGVNLNYAMGNVIRDNNITSNGYGVYIDGTSTNGNWIFLNNFVGNSIQARNNYAGNKVYWNSSAPMSYTYMGNVFTGYVGNYWSTYAGTDSNLDGIGDTPFAFTNGADNYPLVDEGYVYYVPEFPTLLMPLTSMLAIGLVVVLKRLGTKK